MSQFGQFIQARKIVLLWGCNVESVVFGKVSPSFHEVGFRSNTRMLPKEEGCNRIYRLLYNTKATPPTGG